MPVDLTLEHIVQCSLYRKLIRIFLVICGVEKNSKLPAGTQKKCIPKEENILPSQVIHISASLEQH